MSSSSRSRKPRLHHRQRRPWSGFVACRFARRCPLPTSTPRARAHRGVRVLLPCSTAGDSRVCFARHNHNLQSSSEQLRRRCGTPTGRMEKAVANNADHFESLSPDFREAGMIVVLDIIAGPSRRRPGSRSTCFAMPRCKATKIFLSKIVDP